MKIKCAVFDFDGTLFDSMFIWDKAGDEYLKSLGKNPKASLHEDIKALSLQQSADYFKKTHELSISIDEIMTGINKTIEHFYFNEVLPKPGVIDFLNEMQKLKISMCIATASERYQIEAALRRCDMQHFFDAIFTCSEVGFGKDEPVIFREAMKYFDANRKNTIIFEDALHAICTAKDDGFITIGVFDSSEQRQNEIRLLSDFYITDFLHTKDFWKFILN